MGARAKKQPCFVPLSEAKALYSSLGSSPFESWFVTLSEAKGLNLLTPPCALAEKGFFLEQPL